MIVDCICFVWFGVRACVRVLVRRASFVSVLMMIMSFVLNVSCLILSSVWLNVNVCWGIML